MGPWYFQYVESWPWSVNQIHFKIFIFDENPIFFVEKCWNSIPIFWQPNTTQDPGQGGGTANIIQHMAGLSQYTRPGSYNDPGQTISSCEWIFIWKKNLFFFFAFFLYTDYLEPGFFWNSEIDDETEFSFWCLFAAPLLVATGLVAKRLECYFNIFQQKILDFRRK